jgi:hypothetical protein
MDAQKDPVNELVTGPSHEIEATFGFTKDVLQGLAAEERDDRGQDTMEACIVQITGFDRDIEADASVVMGLSVVAPPENNV